jgi:oligoendopeptidase F
MGAMERAMNRVRGIQADRPEIRDAQQVIADYLDSAGATAGEFLDTPDLEAVRADFAAADETRLKAIEEIDDARREVEEAVGYAETLAMNDTTALRSDFERIQSDIQEALDALESAIEALGGTPTPVEEDTGDAEE